MLKDTAEDTSRGQNIETDFCVIGAGAGGLALATAAIAFGQRVVLIEKSRMGGDSLNYGGVPAKALLAAAKRANAMRTASPYGIRGVEPLVDPAAVANYIADTVAEISPNASIERLSGLGIRAITGAGKFINRSTVVAGDYRISARRFVIATGSSPVIPSIPGLADVPYFTTQTIFENKALIPHLIVIGAGPAGLELAQAYRRLGSRVTVLDNAQALAGEDPELAVVLLTRLAREGVHIREGAQIKGVSGGPGKIAVELQAENGPEIIEGTTLLVTAGRKANIADLGLDAAGVRLAQNAVKVNGGLRTANRRVYAIGGATGAEGGAHIASEHAGVVLRRSLFRWPFRTKSGLATRVVFTDPELATVGLSETEARSSYGRIFVLRWPYHENDRAQIEHEPDGHIKVMTSRRGKILGAGIVGAGASELIQMWSLAISQGLNIKAMTEWVSPHPTLSEINKKAAFRYFATAPSSPYLRKVIAFLTKLG